MKAEDNAVDSRYKILRNVTDGERALIVRQEDM